VTGRFHSYLFSPYRRSMVEEISASASKPLLLPIDESMTRYLMLWHVLDGSANSSATTLDARSLPLLGLVDGFCSW